MSKNKIIGRWQIRLATRKPRTWLLHPLHYCIALESMHELIFSISKGKQFSQLDWWFTYYGHIAQLIIVPRCSYLIQQNAKLWKTIWTMIECIYQLGDFMEWFAIHLTRFFENFNLCLLRSWCLNYLGPCTKVLAKFVSGLVLETPLMLGYRDTFTSIIGLVHKINKFI